MPPALQIVQVVGRSDAQQFFILGQLAVGEIRDALDRQGQSVADLDDVLDFGCGCGRVLRHWARLRGPRVHGVDYNRELIEWVARNLPFVDVRQNHLRPPLPFSSASFDLVYALSVFTHLDAELGRLWLAELRRVLRPGGRLFFTTQGEAYVAGLRRSGGREAWERYLASELVVLDDDVSGTNRCSAFHPPPWVRNAMLAGWELEEHRPRSSPAFGHQDAWLVRVPRSGRSEG